MVKIECACCKHSQNKQINNSFNISIEKNCENCIKTALPINLYIQSSTSLKSLFLDVEYLCGKHGVVQNLIIFKDIEYYQFHPKPLQASNKNLDMLRTVILLN
ncbi:MAG: hypothetical protein WC197_06390 [Candidatus Gastranaerophilaceae bacterium]|jgi:hypothetical protein